MGGWKQRKEGGHFPLPFRSLTFLSFSYLTSVQSLTLGVPYFTTNQQTDIFKIYTGFLYMYHKIHGKKI